MTVVWWTGYGLTFLYLGPRALPEEELPFRVLFVAFVSFFWPVIWFWGWLRWREQRWYR